jgi:MFS family permease
MSTVPSVPQSAALPARTTTFQSFKIRNFRLFVTGQIVSQVGNWLTLVAQTLLVLHLTGSGFAIGLLTAFQFAPVLVLGPWAGAVADRVDKRRLLLIVQSIAMLQSFALAALAFSGNPPVAAIYGVALIGGFTVAFDNPARRAIVVEMVPNELVNNAVSLNSAIMTSSRIFGPALAGLLISTVGYGWCFLSDALSYIAVLVGLWMMRPEELRRPPARARSKGDVRAGVRYVRSLPELWIPLTMMAIIGTLAFNFQVVMPLFVTRSLGGTDGTFTILYSVISVGSLAGALLSARRATVTLRNVVWAAVAFGAALLLLAATPNLALAFPAGILMGAGSISFMTTSTAIVQTRADPQMRGRVLALQAMVFLGSTPIGGPIVGAICQVWGARSGLVVGGLAALAAAVYGRTAMRSADARNRFAVDAAAESEALLLTAEPLA